MDRTASMKLKNTACASIIDYELVLVLGLGSSSTTVLLLTSVQSSSLRSDVLVSNEGTLDGGILNRITPLPRDWFEKYLHQALGNYSLSVCADDSISKLSPRPPPLSPSTPCTQPSGTT